RGGGVRSWCSWRHSGRLFMQNGGAMIRPAAMPAGGASRLWFSEGFEFGMGFEPALLGGIDVLRELLLFGREFAQARRIGVGIKRRVGELGVDALFFLLPLREVFF